MDEKGSAPLGPESSEGSKGRGFAAGCGRLTAAGCVEGLEEKGSEV